MTELRRACAAYLRQQAERGMPDVMLGAEVLQALRGSARRAVLRAPAAPAPSSTPSVSPTPAPVASAPEPSRKRPLRDLHAHTPSTGTTVPAEAEDPRREQLKKLFYETRVCTRCGLAGSRNNVVFGAGSVTAPLLVVGEAPGHDEDLQGRPFVGRAGALLTDMLKAIDLDRERDVFITNILKCRPPQNRNPESSEVVQCMPILRAQVEILKPRAILILGRVAATSMLDRHEGVGALRSEEHRFNGIPTFVTYHPAALLRNDSYKRPAWEDLKRLSARLKELT